MRRPLIAGNWKMHGTKGSVTALLSALKQGCESVETAELVVLVPSIFLPAVEESLVKTQIVWGAQNVSHESSGPYTGEISTSMLLEYGCTYALVGHSERRALYSESKEIVSKKFFAAIESGLRPILCVGETAEQREKGQSIQVIKEQLAAVLDMIDNHKSLTHAVVAYEPVWAIGTGLQANPEQVQEIHACIRNQLALVSDELMSNVRVLYGGSVKPSNAAAILAMSDVDGVLVGGASLQADQFLEIGTLCNK